MNHETDKPSLWISIALFMAVMGIYLMASPAHFLTTPDEEINLRTTLSLLEGKRGAIPSLGGFATKTGIDGNEYAQYGLGLPLAAAPWVALGRAIDPSEDCGANRLDSIAETNSAGTPFLRGWATVFTTIVTALTVVLFHALLLRISIPLGTSVFMTLLLAFCTYCWPHGRTFFTEPLAAFCLMAAVWALLQQDRAKRPALWALFAGCFWAYAVLTRLDTLVTLPAAAWFLCVERRDERFGVRMPIQRILCFAIPWIVIFAVILSYNYFRFGSLFSTGYEDQAEKVKFITPLFVGLHGFLFTPGRSIFLYSPPLIFAAFGIWKLWKKDPWLTGGLLLLIGGFLGAMSKWQNWAGGYDWGPRHVYQITPFLMISTAAFFMQRSLFDRPAKRIGWAVLVFIAIYVQFLGLAVDPVLAIKQLLYQWRNAQNSSLYLMQFTIYLPQFSNPVLHWHWILNHGPDLLIVRIANESPRLLLVYLVPLLLSAWGFIVLWKAYVSSGRNHSVEIDRISSS